MLLGGVMRMMILGLIATLSLSAFATPASITCDYRSFFGLGQLTRVELKQIGGGYYELSVLDETSCGRGSDCTYMRIRFKETVEMIQSSRYSDLLITPSVDEKNYSITINTRYKTCEIQHGDEDFRFKGKVKK
jgi:hypothetical protein